MNPWLLLGIAAYLAVEWVAASALASVIGWDGVVLVVLALLLVGAAVMRRAGFAAMRSLRPVSYDGATVVPGPTPQTVRQVGRDVGDAGSLFVAGLLIAVPGLVTSALGLVLLVPPVRRWAGARLAAAVRGRGVGIRTTTVVVEGDVLREDVRDQGSPGGEIVSGEVVRDEPDDDAR